MEKEGIALGDVTIGGRLARSSRAQHRCEWRGERSISSRLIRRAKRSAVNGLRYHLQSFCFSAVESWSRASAPVRSSPRTTPPLAGALAAPLLVLFTELRCAGSFSSLRWWLRFVHWPSASLASVGYFADFSCHRKVQEEISFAFDMPLVLYRLSSVINKGHLYNEKIIARTTNNVHITKKQRNM